MFCLNNMEGLQLCSMYILFQHYPSHIKIMIIHYNYPFLLYNHFHLFYELHCTYYHNYDIHFYHHNCLYLEHKCIAYPSMMLRTMNIYYHSEFVHIIFKMYTYCNLFTLSYILQYLLQLQYKYSKIDCILQMYYNL